MSDVAKILDENTSQTDENMFLDLVQDAKSSLRRLMLNSTNEKIIRETAESVLDRAGKTKKVSEISRPVVHITDSHIQLLVQASKEIAE